MKLPLKALLAPVTAIGASATRQLSQLGALARFLWRIVTAWHKVPVGGRNVLKRILLNQIWFTAVQAIPLIVILATILSTLVISQAIRELGRLGATELIGTLMVVAIVRELGPLLTALTVVGRSGTAIAAEVATNRTMGEIDALEGMGIDPVHYIVLPRFLGSIVSVFGLLVLFDLVSILAGFGAAVGSGMTSARYFDIVLQSLTFQDAWLTLVKGLAFGVVLGTVPAFYGLTAKRAATEVPIASSRAVVVSILGVFILSAIFVVLS
ncbi:MAG: ABC transporter permease [Gemmatimonadota bacterium]|nr:ABC transporter permease [Gemmatimonadota bacterium]